MPFSWDQTIPGHNQTFKQKTIALYIDENRRLDGVGGVREFMKEHYNFDKSVSTYRREFPKWGVKKNDYPSTVDRSSQHSLDSGYVTASNRSSTATSSAYSLVSSINRHSKTSLLRLSLKSRLSSSTQSSFSHPRSHQPDVQIAETISATDPVDCSIGHDTVVNQYTADTDLHDFHASDHPLNAQEPASAPTLESLNHQLYRPPHAPPSKCSRAGTSSEFLDVGLETCHHCGATKLHHLASISRRTDVALFKEVVRSNLDSINVPDNEGNKCIHFAAGAGASLDQLVILQRAGARVTHVNHDGKTLLHILDPNLYGQMMPAVLTFALKHGLNLFQRDYDGHTPLHHMLHRTLSSTNFHHVAPFLEAAGRAMTLLDRSGNTPFDILRDAWQEANSGVHLEQLEANLIACNIPYSFRDLSQSSSRLPAPMPDVSKLAITSYDETTTDILDIINHSQHEPYCQNSSGQNVLHALAAVSFHANYQISCYMTPCGLLECLQHRLENITNVGVDVNQYNSDGLTPLHCFLTTTFDINLDIPWLVPECVKMLLQFGADPRMRDRHGNTALHLACSRGRFECAGKIITHLSSCCTKGEYIQCLSAVNDAGKSAVEEAETCMNSETPEANERRKQCIGLLRVRMCAATGEPMHSYMPAAYSSAASTTSPLGSSAMTWSSPQTANHARRSSPATDRSSSGHRRVSSWFSRTFHPEAPEVEMISAFDD